MKIRKNKKVIIVAAVAILMFIASCGEDKPVPCLDDNYSDDHATNMERCLQSLEDGTAYEIDEDLTAFAPWQVGDIIASTGNDGMGEYYVREFLGVTKAGYYLVQDFMSTESNKKNSGAKHTDPFTFMNLCEVTNMSPVPTIASACGFYTSYYSGAPRTPVNEQGLYLDGTEHGEWIRYYSSDCLADGCLADKKNYIKGVRDGLWVYINSSRLLIFYYDNGQTLFHVTFTKDKPIEIWKHDPNSFVEFNENVQTVQFGYLNNGEKAGIWRKWDAQGVLIEEINYN